MRSIPSPFREALSERPYEDDLAGRLYPEIGPYEAFVTAPRDAVRLQAQTVHIPNSSTSSTVPACARRDARRPSPRTRSRA